MKRRNFFDQPLGISGPGIFDQPWSSVDQTPPNEDDGGGGTDDTDLEDQNLGETGIQALREERAMRKSQAAELAQLKAQLEQLKGQVSPETFAQAQAQALALQQELTAQQQTTAADRQRIEAKANDRVSKAEARASKAEADKVALQIRTAAQSLFLATEGKDGGDGGGQTYFDAWFAFHGSRHIRVDPATGKVFIVDSDGDPVKDGESNIDPAKWLNSQADNSAVVGSFFKPKGGSGGGGLTNARGYRNSQGLTPEQVKAMSPSEKMAYSRTHGGS
jgi:hypothetical protein